MVQDSIRTSNHLNYKIDSTTVQINTFNFYINKDLGGRHMTYSLTSLGLYKQRCESMDKETKLLLAMALIEIISSLLKVLISLITK